MKMTTTTTTTTRAAAGQDQGQDQGQRVVAAVRADSLSTLLSQAVRSGDKTLLERCLAVGQVKVVDTTVRRLLPGDAAALLREVVGRLVARPARGAQLIRWTRAVLVHHAGYLMAAPGARSALTQLYRAIDARLASHRSLASLQGRLELVSTVVLARGGSTGVGSMKSMGAGAGAGGKEGFGFGGGGGQQPAVVVDEGEVRARGAAEALLQQEMMMVGDGESEDEMMEEDGWGESDDDDDDDDDE